MSDRPLLADVMQAEIDGVARRVIRHASAVSPAIGFEIAKGALEAGASPEVVLEELERPLASSPDFVVRAAGNDDINYIRKTWLLEHAEEGICSRRGGSWVDAHGGRAVYDREHKRALEGALERGAVTIACRPTTPSGICGFAVTEAQLVHFVYVKPRWRKLGVAKLLLRPLLEVAAEYTHLTRSLDLARIPGAWSFNPYPFLRG